MRRTVAILTLLMLLLSSLLFLPLCSAAAPQPSIPEFTLKSETHPYDVAPTTTVDPYTGQTYVKDDGYHQENKSINIIINNQPFNSYVDADGHSIGLFYNISAKGHFEDSWHYVDNPYWGILNASNSESTVISLSYGNDPRYPTGGFPLQGLVSLGDYEHGQIDFRVQALIGYYTAYGGYYPSNYVFEGETSGWSSAQTITPGDDTVMTEQPTPYQTVTPTSLTTENPTATPLQPITQDEVLFGLGIWQVATIALVVVVVLLVFVLFYLRRRSVGGAVK
jgi:hypothetical protein